LESGLQTERSQSQDLLLGITLQIANTQGIVGILISSTSSLRTYRARNNSLDI